MSVCFLFSQKGTAFPVLSIVEEALFSVQKLCALYKPIAQKSFQEETLLLCFVHRNICEVHKCECEPVIFSVT